MLDGLQLLVSQKRRWIHAEGFRECGQLEQRQVSDAPFDSGGVGTIQPRGVGQGLL